MYIMIYHDVTRPEGLLFVATPPVKKINLKGDKSKFVVLQEVRLSFFFERREWLFWQICSVLVFSFKREGIIRV